MIWPRTPGDSFLECLLHDRATPAAAVIGRALAEIRRSGVDWPDEHRAPDELSIVARWHAALRMSRPDVALLVDRAVARLKKKMVSTTDLVPCHRDFYDKQWLIDGDGATLVDLDTVCRAEPELDLGNFSAHLTLRRLQYSGLQVDEARRAFFESYLRRAQRIAADRLVFYEACALVRLACVYGLRGRGRDLVAGLVDRALSVLGVPTGERMIVHAL